MEVMTRIGDIVNIESDITLPLLQGLVKYKDILDCHSVNEYQEVEILPPLLYTTHLYFLVICTYSMFTLSYEKILQVYCLDSVLSGNQVQPALKGSRSSTQIKLEPESPIQVLIDFKHWCLAA